MEELRKRFNYITKQEAVIELLEMMNERLVMRNTKSNDPSYTISILKHLDVLIELEHHFNIFTEEFTREES